MVTSETGTLKKVIVHRPDDGIEIVTPGKALEFLYDDIVYLPKMREEHDVFTKVLSAFLGETNVYDTQTLLEEVLLKHDEALDKLINYVCNEEKCSEEIKLNLRHLSIHELVYTLFTGYCPSNKKFFFSPLPNYVFTRDIGVIANDHVIICNASKKARTREAILTRCIIYYHELFKKFHDEDKIIDLTKESSDVTLEGGDVMIYNNNTMLIGCSSRTTEKALEVIVNKLFERKVVKHVVKIDIPKQRSSMHIDTIFTQISKSDFVVYAPYVLKDKALGIQLFTANKKSPEAFPTLKDFLITQNPDTRFILCGGGEFPYDEREQWTDGCNLVAVKDGVAIAYDRNARTAQALANHGYNVASAETVIEAHANGLIKPDYLEKTIITIPATELSRARGGPHCMTFPIERN